MGCLNQRKKVWFVASVDLPIALLYSIGPHVASRCCGRPLLHALVALRVAPVAHLVVVGSSRGAGCGKGLAAGGESRLLKGTQCTMQLKFHNKSTPQHLGQSNMHALIALQIFQPGNIDGVNHFC